MADLISRQAAIDAFKKELSAKYNGREFAIGFVGVESILENVPSAQRWIPVTEALPKDDEEVIVSCIDDSGDTPFRYTTVAWHYKDTWVCENERCPFVVAWMEKPEPWRGEEHEL